MTNREDALSPGGAANDTLLGGEGHNLLEADVGVSTHFEHVETAFSYRTRILDYLWAGLPIIATQGDSLSRLVNQHDLGITVPAEDTDACAADDFEPGTRFDHVSSDTRLAANNECIIICNQVEQVFSRNFLVIIHLRRST